MQNTQLERELERVNRQLLQLQNQGPNEADWRASEMERLDEEVRRSLERILYGICAKTPSTNTTQCICWWHYCLLCRKPNSAKVKPAK